jgi:hypothetical protein
VGSQAWKSDELQEEGSSSPFEQSWSPSHSHDLGMQRPDWHLSSKSITDNHEDMKKLREYWKKMYIVITHT